MTNEAATPKPLEGVRALEWGAFHAGPGALAILGDLGAEVIKIEQPNVGDPIRRLARFGNVWVSKGGHSIFYEGANRHKKSIALDLAKPEGQEVVHRLVSQCDVFLTNFRPKAVEHLGMTYAILREFNPRLIYASVSAYGHHGPDNEQGAFDFLGQARSGMMWCMGEPGMPPLISQFGLIDQVTAITASHAILTALFVRERTGIGQELKLSILSSAMFLQYFNVLNALIMDQEVPRHDRKSTDPLRNYYQCQDGHWICITLAHHDWNWKEFCTALDHEELAKDPRFDNRDSIQEHREELIALLDSIFATRTQSEWLKALSQRDIFCAPVNNSMALRQDPQALANAYVVGSDHRFFGNIMVPGYPVDFSRTPAETRGPAPELGEHTEEILLEVAGYSDEDIERLRRAKAI